MCKLCAILLLSRIPNPPPSRHPQILFSASLIFPCLPTHLLTSSFFTSNSVVMKPPTFPKVLVLQLFWTSMWQVQKIRDFGSMFGCRSHIVTTSLPQHVTTFVTEGSFHFF